MENLILDKQDLSNIRCALRKWEQVLRDCRDHSPQIRRDMERCRAMLASFGKMDEAEVRRLS
jgi:hypothetical protein